MDPIIKAKLDAVMAKQSGYRQAEAEKQVRMEELARKKQSELEQVEAKWRAVYSLLQTVVAEMNEAIKELKLVFAIEDQRAGKTSDGIAQTIVALNPDTGGNNRRGVVLNVSGGGWVNPVFMIPHTGKAPDRFNLDAATPEFLSSMLVEFLDQSLAYQDAQKDKS